jgi:hypothetical protein
MKRIPLITITPTIKVQFLRAMACLKALSISHLPKKFQKIHLQIGITAVCPDSLNSIYESHGPLGVNFYFNLIIIFISVSFPKVKSIYSKNIDQ